MISKQAFRSGNEGGFSVGLAAQGGVQWPRGTFPHILLGRYEVVAWRGSKEEAIGKSVSRGSYNLDGILPF